VLSRAIMPVQELDPNGAVVTIQVGEGYIETVEWPPQLSAYRDFFSYYAERPGRAVPVRQRVQLGPGHRPPPADPAVH
jgi:hypothetical protein